RADHDVLPQGRVPLGPFVQRGAAQRDTLVNRAAVTDLGGLADDDAHGMVEKHALADFCAGVDFNAGEPARNMRNKAAQPFEAVVPAPVRAAVQHLRMHARVAGQHFPGRAGGRVAVKNALDVGADSGKHDAKSTGGPACLLARSFCPLPARLFWPLPATWPWPRRAGYGFLRDSAARG